MLELKDNEQTQIVLTLDIVKEQLKIWYGNFEASVLSSTNPYSQKSTFYKELMAMNSEQQKVFLKNKMEHNVRVFAFPIKDVIRCR